METSIIKNLFFLRVLLVGLGFMQAGRVAAQNFTSLHNFTNGINDGAYPDAGLVVSGNILYGTTSTGGGGEGTVFKVSTDGTGFTILHNFNYTDGANPVAGLILSGNTLYGTTPQGGTSGYGTVFAVGTDGTGFTNLYDFRGPEGATPLGRLILSGSLYGTTEFGGSSGRGTVFKVNTDGSGFTDLYSFTAVNNSTNSDGANPSAGLVLSGNTLYGTAYYGGRLSYGTLFALRVDGTDFTNLHNFTGGSDGGAPTTGLLLSGNNLYGTAPSGSNILVGLGTVFAINIDSTGFTTLYNFTLDSDGYSPIGGLALSENTIYGTAYQGGSSGYGTVFAINTDGTGPKFRTLHSFSPGGSANLESVTNSDGAHARGDLIISGNTLYGTTVTGSSWGYGTVFSVLLLPQVSMTRSGPNIILTWPTNTTGFTLQSTTNLGSSAIWTTNSPAPVVVNGQNTVTNPISGTQQFFRLSQ